MGDTATSNQTLTFTAASTALEVQNGGQIQLGITNETYNSTAYVAAIGSGAATDALSFLTGVGSGELASWNAAPAATSDMDFINLTNGAISLGTRSGGAGTGVIAIADLGYVTTAAQGDVFNLIDWQGVMGGTFSAGTGFVNGGVLGDFDLPTLGAGLGWDTSAFTSYGIVVVVPEPSRALLLLLGVAGLLLRRRR